MPNPQVNYRADPEIMDQVRLEAKRLRLTISQALDAAAKFWIEYIEKNGNDLWLPR